MERLEEIRLKAQRGGFAFLDDDVLYLLERIEELTKERDKYEFWYEQTKKTLVGADIRIEELEKENEEKLWERTPERTRLYRRVEELEKENERLEREKTNIYAPS